MVGSTISRVLSRTKLVSSPTVETVFNEKYDFPSMQEGKLKVHDVDLVVSERKNYRPDAGKRSSITFEDTTFRPVSRQTLFDSTRKHSYASVKEDSDNLQSFTTRKRHDSDDNENESILENLRRISSRKVDLFRSRCRVDGAESEVDEDEDAITDDLESLEGFSPIIETDIVSLSSLSSIREPASLVTMPDEILDTIFSHVTLEADKDRYIDPRVDLFSCLFVSKAIHAAALRVLYRHVKIPQSKAFFKFLNSLTEDEHLGKLVQCLDFSHYSSIGFGRARSTNNDVPYLTPITLKACLERTENLQAFLVHEHVDDELDAAVLSRVMNLPYMRAVDLCSCSSKSFSQAFTQVCTELTLNPRTFLNIERLSLHECTTLRPQVFEDLLPHLNRLTHLDVAHTMINDQALMSIPESARLTHLNLERCTQVTGSAVVKFLTTHPAVKHSIVYLNLMADASRYRLLSEDEVSQLLSALPTTLRSLNIGGARVNSSHVRLLQKLSTHLEELGLKGASLGLSGDVARILSLVPLENETVHDDSDVDTRSTLKYLDLTDVKSVTKMSLYYSPTPVTGYETMPLEVIELGEAILTDINKSVKKIKQPDWVVRELGRRGWYVRQKDHLPPQHRVIDDGYRKWKMGAKWWGMRKIPVFDQDTGGMYGYFMFKRA